VDELHGQLDGQGYNSCIHTSFVIFMVIKIQVAVFWVVTLQ